MDSSPSAPQAVEELIARAEQARASDVHLQMGPDGAEVVFRLDGVMTPVSRFEKELADRVFGRIKYLARLKTYQESLPQDGRINKSEAKARGDIRVATYPTVTGEKIVLRFFTEEGVRGLRELGLPEDATEALETALRRNSGLILLTGPAGSGKTTTIYSALKFLVEMRGRHIITVEDPVEQIIAGVMQTEVNEARGLTFATAARHLLRQDPQVLVIGEVRDEETARIAVRAASTGHLVIATLHGGSCRGVLERLAMLSSELPSVLSSLELVVNQRLVRRTCADCAGNGCEVCLQTGFKGRIPIMEYVRFVDELRLRVRQEGFGVVAPTVPLEKAATEAVRRKHTTAAELQRALPDFAVENGLQSSRENVT